MNYSIQFNIKGGVFAVPNDVVDRHIRLCSGVHLKVLLLALRDVEGRLDAGSAAKLLGISPADAADAANYWVQAGLFEPTDGSPDQQEAVPAFAAIPVAATTTQTVEETHSAPTGQRVTTLHTRSRLTTADINKLAKTDSNIPMLLQECQSRLGKELTPAESEALVWLYSYLNLSPDYILMVTEYCKSMSKGNMRSIERTAISWFDQGIDTHDKAEQHIRRLGEQVGYENQVKMVFGIHDRELTAKEREFARIWCEDFGFGMDMLRMAYEKTVDQTGKLSFPYCGKILSSWHTAGIKTPKQAAEERKPQNSAKNNQKGGFSSFDLNEVESLLRHE